ncbi:MAG: hypothetical protein Q8P67_14825 [archaeon]|nr:hypothetical protein [archaeon]
MSCHLVAQRLFDSQPNMHPSPTILVHPSLPCYRWRAVSNFFK